MAKRAAVSMAAVGAIFVYGGCSSAPAGVGTSVSEVASADTGPVNCVENLGQTVPWLLLADCTCPTFPPDDTTHPAECYYEKYLYQALVATGYTGSCATLPALPKVTLETAGAPSMFYVALDGEQYFPGNCTAVNALKERVYQINTAYHPFTHSRYYETPPISARFAHRCEPTFCDPSMTRDLIDIFDPCSSSNCKTQ